jgi:Ankyrin repeats (3 copies)/Ankyrin repeat
MNVSLLAAAKSGYEDKVRRLLISRADIEAQDENGETALLLASDKYDSHIDTMRVLLSMDANVDAKDEIGWTALFWGCASGHVESVSLLLEFGANVNLQDDDLDTPLHIAIECGMAAIVRLLMDKGADPLVKNRNGDSPLDEAMSDGTLSDSLMRRIQEVAEKKYEEQHTSLTAQMDTMRLDIDDLLEQCQEEGEKYAKAVQAMDAFWSEKLQTINEQIESMQGKEVDNVRPEQAVEERIERALARLGGDVERNQMNVIDWVSGSLSYLAELVVFFICWMVFGASAGETLSNSKGNSHTAVAESLKIAADRGMMSEGLRGVAARMKKGKNRGHNQQPQMRQQQHQQFDRMRDFLVNTTVMPDYEQAEEQDLLLEREARFRLRVERYRGMNQAEPCLRQLDGQ